MKRKWLAISIMIASIIVVAGLGSLFVNLGMDWFNSLIKPKEWIPNFVIPIVWTVVYLAFAIILFLWLSKDKIDKTTLVYLILNGIFNILWCLVFFTLNQLFLGNIVIIINAIIGVVLIVKISSYNKIYSRILSIYPIWLCIATSLNLALWILN